MRYEPNIRDMGRFLKTSGELRDVCRQAAREVAQVAVDIAPVYRGHYRDSIDTIEMSGIDRVGAGVQADDEAAAAVEFGNKRTGGRGRHTLTVAAEIAGLDVRAAD